MWPTPRPPRPRTLWQRLPPSERAGTVLDWRAGNCEEIAGPDYQRPGCLRTHGVLDRRQRVYQSGGELKNFAYWKEDLLTLDAMVWGQIAHNCEWIELIDHELNRCYRIRTTTAIREGRRYDAGIGERWGVPRVFWSVSDGPLEPERPAPTAEPTVRQAKLF